ncbi:MAG TPA: right-handed parallel beta-helix repeat-containing protein, partial [Methylomirabilota bacterium]|nr:right-handed parallel beta-helix repeat-containing protein [Methylomirabilota bacterium]
PTSTLWLSECLIASNTDSGVTSEGTLIMNRCTVAGNSTTGAGYAPGGIATSGAAFITNSTISGNFGANGGGIFNLGALILANCTITDNDALYGGGIYNFPHQTLNPTTRCVSSLIAGNRAGTGSDVLGSFISGGFNLIGQTNDSAGWGATGDLPGRAGAPLLPLLGPLGDHGGPTPTHALLAGSPALDRGHANGLLSDERGFLRTVDLSGVANPLGGDGTDIGAYEFSPVALSITRLGGQVILGWPAWSEFLRLEVTASLPASNSWSAVNAPVVVSNGTNTVTVNATGDSRFYRLAPSAIPAGCTPAPVGLVAWWRAEENTADSRGNLHGTLQNGLGFTTGKVGQAFDFTAAGQSVRVPANPALDVGAGDGFTIEGWIHPA